MHGAGDDEHRHGIGETADGGAHDEDGDASNVEPLAAQHVTQLAGNRHGDGHGDKECGDDPAHVVNAAKLTNNRWQSGRENHLAQRAHQHGEHQRREDEPQVIRPRLALRRSLFDCIYHRIPFITSLIKVSESFRRELRASLQSLSGAAMESQRASRTTPAMTMASVAVE